MKKNLSKKKKVSPDDGRTVLKDEAGHTIEELYGVHIISRDDIEHHSGMMQKQSGEINQKFESSESTVKSKGKKKKSRDDSDDTK